MSLSTTTSTAIGGKTTEESATENNVASRECDKCGGLQWQTRQLGALLVSLVLGISLVALGGFPAIGVAMGADDGGLAVASDSASANATAAEDNGTTASVDDDELAVESVAIEESDRTILGNDAIAWDMGISGNPAQHQTAFNDEVRTDDAIQVVNYPCLLTHRYRGSFLEAGASWFNDALCRNNRSSRRERSLHRR